MAAHAKQAKVVQLSIGERLDGMHVGRIVAFGNGEVRVDFDANPHGPLLARVASTLDAGMLARAAIETQEAVLLFDEGDPCRPVVIALLRTSASVDRTIATARMPRCETVARVDGKHVVIKGEEEVVIECGKSKLTLRSDGRVVLRGVNIVSQADQVHKVRGSKVQIN